MSAISKEEVALYDRQIRLWGMEAQTRLRSSSICFVGVKALTLEACKNLVLAGIGTLTLVDPHPVTSADLEVQYYFTSDDLGEPRANVLARSLRVLNPLVDIRVSEDVEGKYDVVVRVGTGGQNDERRVSVLADSVGLFGYIFVDCLGTHEYVEEVRPEGEGEVKRVKCVAEYHALAQSLVARVEGSNVQRLRRKYPPLVFVFQALVAAGKLDASSVTAERLEQLVNDMLR
ncbi:E1 ubiquitin-activating protein aos1, partial [Coemansia erecta]